MAPDIIFFAIKFSTVPILTIFYSVMSYFLLSPLLSVVFLHQSCQIGCHIRSGIWQLKLLTREHYEKLTNQTNKKRTSLFLWSCKQQFPHLTSDKQIYTLSTFCAVWLLQVKQTEATNSWKAVLQTHDSTEHVVCVDWARSKKLTTSYQTPLMCWKDRLIRMNQAEGFSIDTVNWTPFQLTS